MLREAILVDIADPAPLHRRCAEAVIDRADPGSAERRAEHLIAAGDAAGGSLALRYAINRYERRIDFADVDRLLPRLASLVDAHPEGRDRDLARATYHAVRADTETVRGRAPEGEREAREALRIAEPLDPVPHELLARIHATLCETTRSRSSFEETQTHVERSLHHARAAADPVATARALRYTATMHLLRGELDRADPPLREALPLLPDDMIHQVDVLRTIAAVAGARGAYREALELLDAARPFAERGRLRLGAFYVALESAAMRRQLRETDTALALLDAQRAHVGLFGALREALLDASIALTFARAGDDAAAEAHAARAAPPLRAHGRPEAALMTMVQALAARRSGAPTDVAAALAERSAIPSTTLDLGWLTAALAQAASEPP
jgi:tetratricopeptide (TPR) repeat protein